MSGQSRLYSILANAEIVALIGLPADQRAGLFGMGRRIADTFSEIGITKVIKAGFFFTQANGGDFFAKLMVKNKNGKKQTLVISEKPN